MKYTMCMGGWIYWKKQWDKNKIWFHWFIRIIKKVILMDGFRLDLVVLVSMGWLSNETKVYDWYGLNHLWTFYK